jgi:hypothetical protein
MRKFLVVALIFVFIIMLGACDTLDNQVSPAEADAFIHTLTATMWTPAPVTPSATPVPNEAVIVNALNDASRGADPLEETLDAKFSILDISFHLSGKPLVTTTLEVHVECEWITRPSCTVERAFVALAHAFKAVKADVRKKIIGQIPETVLVVQVRAFDHITKPLGIIEVGWQDLLAFANGDITGDQLGTRILRFIPPP